MDLGVQELNDTDKVYSKNDVVDIIEDIGMLDFSKFWDSFSDFDKFEDMVFIQKDSADSIINAIVTWNKEYSKTLFSTYPIFEDLISENRNADVITLIKNVDSYVKAIGLKDIGEFLNVALETFSIRPYRGFIDKAKIKFLEILNLNHIVEAFSVLNTLYVNSYTGRLIIPDKHNVFYKIRIPKEEKVSLTRTESKIPYYIVNRNDLLDNERLMNNDHIIVNLSSYLISGSVIGNSTDHLSTVYAPTYENEKDDPLISI